MRDYRAPSGVIASNPGRLSDGPANHSDRWCRRFGDKVLHTVKARFDLRYPPTRLLSLPKLQEVIYRTTHKLLRLQFSKTSCVTGPFGLQRGRSDLRRLRQVSSVVPPLMSDGTDGSGSFRAQSPGAIALSHLSSLLRFRALSSTLPRVASTSLYILAVARLSNFGNLLKTRAPYGSMEKVQLWGSYGKDE